ncbi:MAG: anti-sigma factor [bacterium]
MKATITIIIIVLVVVLWFVFAENTSEEEATTTDTTSKSDTVTEKEMIETDLTEDVAMKEMTDEDKDEMDEIEYDYEGTLEDVSDSNATGFVKADFTNNTYMLLATFENLPDLEEGYFYEGWVVRNSPLSVVSTGKVEKKDDVYTNMYSSAQGLIDHKFYVLTLEPDDGDLAPADHILEGNLSKK